MVIEECPNCHVGSLEASVKVYLDDVKYDTETFRIEGYKVSSLHRGETVKELVENELADSLANVSVSCDNCSWKEGD